MSKTRVALASVGFLALMTSLTGCAPAASHFDAAKLNVIIDVRIEDKYVYGHLDRALGADWQMDTFTGRVINIPRVDHIGVYGKDKADAAEAIRKLINLGFKHLVNLGSLDDAVAITHGKIVI